MKENIHDKVKKFCPKDASVYFNQDINTITIILNEDIGKDKRCYLQAQILSYLGIKMLHDTYRTVKIMW